MAATTKFTGVDASGLRKGLVIDRDKLEKAVLNLLSNAFKYIPGEA